MPLLSCSSQLLECALGLGLLHELDMLALLIAALCHDLDHDGFSNSFHVNSQSKLSRIYNDVSVLENHHCAMAFAILDKKECNLFEPLAKDQQRALRKAIIAVILSTDMTKHFAVTSEFRSHGDVFLPEDEADRLLLSKVIMHAADIGNAVRPFHVNNIMSQRVHLEFHLQAAREKEEALPITFSVDTANAVSCSEVEVNFLDLIVVPLWERLVEVLPEMEPQFLRLLDNRARYRAMLGES